MKVTIELSPELAKRIHAMMETSEVIERAMGKRAMVKRTVLGELRDYVRCRGKRGAETLSRESYMVWHEVTIELYCQQKGSRTPPTWEEIASEAIEAAEALGL